MTASSRRPTLLLLHGLGATAGVWADLRDKLDWQGRVVAPDLPGHGDGAWTGDYTVGALAAAVSGECENGEEVLIVGHSLGGGVALALASGIFRPVAVGVLGLGIKVGWTADDVAGMAKVADRGVRWFESRTDAVDRFLRQAGLVDVVGPGHAAVQNAVVDDGGRWRVAQDPATFAQRPLDVAGLVNAARCPVVLGAGENDAMVAAADLAHYVSDPRIAAGRGHNVQVEDPEWVAELVGELDS